MVHLDNAMFKTNTPPVQAITHLIDGGAANTARRRKLQVNARPVCVLLSTIISFSPTHTLCSTAVVEAILASKSTGFCRLIIDYVCSWAVSIFFWRREGGSRILFF